MKNQRHYEVFKFDQPLTKIWEKDVFNFGLTETKNGETKQMSDTFYAFVTEEEAKEKCEELNNTFYLSDYSNEEIEEWFNQIDFTPLYKKANEVIGLDLHYTCKPEESYRSKLLDGFNIYSTEDLARLDTPVGKVLRAAWKKFTVQTFSSAICVRKSTGELYIWGNLDFKYEHQDGGSNGAHILDFTYSVENGWKLFSAEEQRIENEKRWAE